jgi:hypothetical protein
VVDEQGYLYLVNGNGTVDTDTPSPTKTEFGSSFLKLQTHNGKITVADWFTPYNYTSLNEADLDTGSTSFVTIPGTQMLVAGSKAGFYYVLNKQKFGGFDMFDDKQIVQRFQASKGFLYSTPVLWGREGGNPWLYSWGMNDRLKAFEWNGTQFNPLPISQSDEKISSPRPGGFLTLSAQGKNPLTAILWALQPTGDANHNVVPGILRAFNASDLKQEVWNSRINASRDGVGQYAKFCPPVVANGRVYVASFSNQLHVYGLNPPPQAQAPIIRSRSNAINNFITLETEQNLATIHYTLDGSDPTSLSPRYRTPFRVDQIGQVKARAFAKGYSPSLVTSGEVVDPGFVGSGDGLAASYFATVDLSGPPVRRINALIDNNQRPQGIPGQNWSARWEGQLQATHTGPTTFYTRSDDGIRVWVNNQLLIDNWLTIQVEKRQRPSIWSLEKNTPSRWSTTRWVVVLRINCPGPPWGKRRRSSRKANSTPASNPA